MIRFIRYIFFCLFFASGTVAIVLSFMIKPELTNHFQSVYMLDKIEKDNEKIVNLIDLHNARNALIESEPNVLSRLQQLSLGQPPPPQEGVINPSDYNLQLAAMAKEVLEENPPQDPNDYTPVWAKRCAIPRFRYALFFSGAGLLMIAFMFFGSSYTRSKK